MGYLYLATPYSKYPGGIVAAYELACCEQARLISAGIAVFCPISHTHGPAIHGDIDPLDHGIWLPADQPFMDGADGIVVLTAESWELSYGMRKELEAFQAAGKSVHWMAPGEIPESLKVQSFIDRAIPDCMRGSVAKPIVAAPPAADGRAVTPLLRMLYGAAYNVDHGLRRECDHAIYEGNTESVDDLREILGYLETKFPSLVYEPSDDF